MGTIAIARGDPPNGSLHAPTITPPVFSTRLTISWIDSEESSNLQSSGSNPFVFGFAFRDARLRLVVGLGAIPLSLMEITEPGRCGILHPMFLSLAPLRKHRDYRL